MGRKSLKRKSLKRKSLKRKSIRKIKIGGSDKDKARELTIEEIKTIISDLNKHGSAGTINNELKKKNEKYHYINKPIKPGLSLPSQNSFVKYDKSSTFYDLIYTNYSNNNPNFTKEIPIPDLMFNHTIDSSSEGIPATAGKKGLHIYIHVKKNKIIKNVEYIILHDNNNTKKKEKY